MNSLILSMSRIEQKDLFQKIIFQHLVGPQYKPLISLIDKLFLGSIEKSLGPGERLNKIKFLLNHKVTGASINNKSFHYIINFLNEMNDVKSFKCFGLIFLDSINKSSLISKESREFFSANSSHEVGYTGDSNNFGSTMAAVLTWLLNQQSVAVAELRLKLLPLDMLPSAFISEINEKALELTGELALVEVGGNVTISINVLNDVMVNLQSLQFDLNSNFN